MSPASVLVTGAAGLVGRAVVDALSERGRTVVGCGRRSAPMPDGVTFVEVDLSTTLSRSVTETFGSIAAIVHCASAVPRTAEEPSEQVAETNRRVDESVLRLSRLHDARLVYCSSMSVYGHSFDGIASELTAVEPPSAYASQKLASEALVVELPSYAVLRLSSPYGARLSRPTVLTSFARQVAGGQPVGYFGSGARSQDFVHVADVARACISAVDTTSKSLTANICSGEPISMRSLAETFVRIAGLPAGLVRASGRPDPQETFRARYDRALARDAFGWQPRVSLEDGLRELIDACRADLAG